MNIKQILRIIAYIGMIIALILLRYTTLLNFGCVIHDRTGIDCPTCGFTRALLSILDFKFIEAVNYNAFFTLIIFPLFAFLIIQDIIYIIFGILKSKKYLSYIEIIFGE